MQHVLISALGAAALAGSALSAPAEALRPHEAVYDLTMTSEAEGVEAIEARIALSLTAPNCADYHLDYRFVARFQRSDDVTVTDQQTVATEAVDGRRFEFRTVNLADGTQQSVVEGVATNDADTTSVEFRQPVGRTTTLPLATFPLAHTAELVRQASAGRRTVETAIFDGDEEADGSLSTTAVILPAPTNASPLSEIAGSGLTGLTSWWVDESYYDRTSDGEGQAIFRTRYRLFENGVSDEVLMDFGEYAIAGKLRSLSLGTPPSCPP